MTDVLTRDRPALPDEPTPIDVWLRRQQDLSAVERFAARHDEFEEFGVAVPDGRWRERLPATAPGPGQQYAFEVDLDSCTGCKSCVAACHSLNGLDEGEDWRRVGTLHDASGTSGGGITVTSACHHCVDPACMKGCPARAYEKDPVTGIVRHLDDACIGCSYCTLTCPYEVPVLNRSLGIVRKCDLCSDRLAVGEAPACVQGCPQGAITIALVSTDDLLAAARLAPDHRQASLVPTAPRSRLTVPSTSYTSVRPVPSDWVAADRSSVHPAHGHTPLAVMLVLTQAAVGMTVAAAWLEAGAGAAASSSTALASVGLATGLVALAASLAHLGRPLLAWRAILGLRHSWLSREILAFGVFAGAGAATAGLRLADAPDLLVTASQVGTVAGGLAGVGCSVRLYAVTGRRWWRSRTTGLRFAGTTVACGALGTAAIASLTDPVGARTVLPVLLLATFLGLGTSVLAPLLPLARPRADADHAPLLATRRLLRQQLQQRFRHRLVAAALGLGLVLVALAARAAASPSSSGLLAGLLLVAAWVSVTIGELHERRLFFLASVAPRMPRAPR